MELNVWISLWLCAFSSNQHQVTTCTWHALDLMSFFDGWWQTKKHTCSSWQCLDGANNRHESLAWIQSCLYTPKELPLSLFHLCNQFWLSSLEDIDIKGCTKSLIFWTSCIAVLVRGLSRDGQTDISQNRELVMGADIIYALDYECP